MDSFIASNSVGCKHACNAMGFYVEDSKTGQSMDCYTEDTEVGSKEARVT